LDYRRRKGLPVSLKSRYSPLTVIWQAMYAVRRADHVVCSNSDDLEFLVRAGVSRDRLTCHTSGADEEFFAAARAPELPHRDGILFLGSWVIRKGTHDLVPAITDVLRQRPKARFTIVGSGAWIRRDSGAVPRRDSTAHHHPSSNRRETNG
jgi:glycosyltransferase involved in cell wall biosynthesis